MANEKKVSRTYTEKSQLLSQLVLRLYQLSDYSEYLDSDDEDVELPKRCQEILDSIKILSLRLKQLDKSFDLTTLLEKYNITLKDEMFGLHEEEQIIQSERKKYKKLIREKNRLKKEIARLEEENGSGEYSDELYDLISLYDELEELEELNAKDIPIEYSFEDVPEDDDVPEEKEYEEVTFIDGITNAEPSVLVSVQNFTYSDKYSKYFRPWETSDISEEDLYAKIKSVIDDDKSKALGIDDAINVLSSSVYADTITKSIEEYAEIKVKSGLLRKPDADSSGIPVDKNYSEEIRARIEAMVNGTFSDDGAESQSMNETDRFISELLGTTAKSENVSSEDKHVKTYLGYSPAVEEGYESKLKLKDEVFETSGYPEDRYSTVSSFSYFGGKGKLMPRLCHVFDELHKEQDFDVFIDAFSGSSTVACNETSGAKHVICNDVNTMSMISANFLSKGSEYFLGKIPELIDTFFSMAKKLEKWPVVRTEAKLCEVIHSLLTEYFDVSYEKSINDGAKKNLYLFVVLKKSVDELHSALVDMVQSEWFINNRNAEIISCMDELFALLETDEMYDKLTFDDSVIPVGAKRDMAQSMSSVEAAQKYCKYEYKSKEYYEFAELLSSYTAKFNASKEIYELMLKCYYPFARLLFDISHTLHMEGKSNLLIREYPLNFKEFFIMREMAPCLEIEDPAVLTNDDSFFELDRDVQKREKRMHLTRLKKMLPDSLDKWYQLYDSTFGYDFKRLECFYSIPIDVVESLFDSEEAVMSLYIFRLSSSHMNAGLAFSSEKFTNFLSGYLELKRSMEDAKHSSVKGAVRKAIINHLGTSYKDRFRRLYNFAHKFGPKNVHFTCFGYQEIIQRVVPALLDKGLKVCLYCDPPYAETAQHYTSLMDGQSHLELIEAITQINNPNLTTVVSLNEDGVIPYKDIQKRIEKKFGFNPWVLYRMGSIEYASKKGDSSVEYIFVNSPVKLEEAPSKVFNHAEIMYRFPTKAYKKLDKDNFVDDSKYKYTIPYVPSKDRCPKWGVLPPPFTKDGKTPIRKYIYVRPKYLCDKMLTIVKESEIR